MSVIEIMMWLSHSSLITVFGQRANISRQKQLIHLLTQTVFSPMSREQSVSVSSNVCGLCAKHVAFQRVFMDKSGFIFLPNDNQMIEQALNYKLYILICFIFAKLVVLLGRIDDRE